MVVPTAAAIWPNDPSALSYFQPIRVWMQFTRLGLGVLSSVNEAVVWATDMKAGTPVPNLSFRWSSMDARDTVADDNGDLFARLPLKVQPVVTLRLSDCWVVFLCQEFLCCRSHTRTRTRTHMW